MVRMVQYLMLTSKCLIAISFMVSSCGAVKNPDKTDDSSLHKTQISESMSIKFVPDSTINGLLKLRDPESFTDFFGKGVSIKDDPSSPYPYYIAISKDEKKFIKVNQFYGDAKYQISIIEVGYTNNLVSKKNHLKYTQFETESGIKLGMSRKNIINIKGEPDSIVDNQYKYSLSEKNSFVKRNLMPSYFAIYSFENDTLINFQFGFDFP